jgi:hypothetical protein
VGTSEPTHAQSASNEVVCGHIRSMTGAVEESRSKAELHVSRKHGLGATGLEFRTWATSVSDVSRHHTRKEDGTEKAAQTATPTRLRWDATAAGQSPLGTVCVPRSPPTLSHERFQTLGRVGGAMRASGGFEGRKSLLRKCSREAGEAGVVCGPVLGGASLVVCDPQRFRPRGVICVICWTHFPW